MILAIERSWGKHPGWYGSLPVEDQARLLALWNVENTSAEEADGKKAEAAAREARARQEELGGED